MGTYVETIISPVGHLGMIARLKRLSDSMLYSIRDLYREKGLDLEPNWHFVFLILKKYQTRTMTEMADAFGLSQPAVVKIINKMKKKGYIDILNDVNDSRKRQLQLSQRAKDELPTFEKIWNGGQKSIEEMLQENKEFLNHLEKLEQQIRQKDFKERVLSNLRQRK